VNPRQRNHVGILQRRRIPPNLTMNQEVLEENQKRMKVGMPTKAGEVDHQIHQIKEVPHLETTGIGNAAPTTKIKIRILHLGHKKMAEEMNQGLVTNIISSTIKMINFHQNPTV